MSMLDDLDLTTIQDGHARELIVWLLNMLETVTTGLQAAQIEIQRLQNEINRLKGEQGTPPLAGKVPGLSSNYSSERERRTPRGHPKGPKNTTIRIDREQVLAVDPTILPPDAQFKGYEDVVVQDVIFHTDNVRFRKQKFYFPTQHATYLAPLPQGYAGQFGPGIKALALVLYFAGQMSEPKILELFRSTGVQISAGQFSALLIADQDQFHTEKDAVYTAGLCSSPWQHLDDTSTQVDVQSYHCHIVCNPLHTTYHTTSSKDRQAVLDVLRNRKPRVFRLNGEALRYLDLVGLSGVLRAQLSYWPHDKELDEATVQRLLDQHLPASGPQQRKWILDATAPEAAACLRRQSFGEFARAHRYRQADKVLSAAYARLQAAYPVSSSTIVAAYQEEALFLARHLLAKFGDDRERFPSASSLQSLAGTCPVTEQSGKGRRIVFRQACDPEFRQIAQQWAKASVSQSSWASTYWHSVPEHSRSSSHPSAA